MNVPPPPPDDHRGTPRAGRPHPGRTAHGGSAFPGSADSSSSEDRLYPLATWKSRVLARGIDMVVVALPALLLAALLSLVWLGVQTLVGGSGEYGIFLAVTFFVLCTGYEAFALSRWNQTIGKRLVGVKVAPATGAGRLGPLPTAALIVRAAVFGFPVLLFFLPAWLWWTVLAAVAVLTGGLPAWDRPNQQGIHDKVAGTVVLDVT